MFLELFLVLLALIWFNHHQKLLKLPPGPFSLPLIGTVQLFLNGLGAGAAVSPQYHKYGDFYTICLGTMTLVVINDFQLSKELFSRDEFSGRLNFYIHRYIRGQNGRALGVVTTEGQVWAQQRRFALKHLRDLGFGKKSLDSVMIEEADQLIDKLLARNPNGVVEIQGTFNIAIINVLWEIVASKRFDPDAQDTKIMMEMLNKQFKNGFSLRRFFPTFICQFLPFGEHELAILEMKEMMRDLIKEHLKNIDYDNPRDFMDVYLKEIQNDSNFEIEHLVVMCLDFFMAGAETSSTTLSWAMMYLALNPDVQDKCYQYIQNLGEKEPSIEDATKLPYIKATLMEIQRISRVAQGSLIHRLTKDTKVQNFEFKAGQHFIINVEKFLMDPKEFPDPQKFNPDRFLNQGQIVKKDYFVPFGIGKRICMGETLAKNEIFIFFVRLLQKLKIEPTEHKPDPENFVSGITRIPNAFEIKISERK